LKIARGKLEEVLYSHSNKSLIKEELSPSVIDDLLNNLGETLSAISSRILILELNVARVSGKLRGETSEERASYFNQALLNDPTYVRSIREEYIVLTRLLATKTMYWIQNTSDLLVRFHQDKGILESEFSNGQKLGKIISIDTGSGVSDTHNKGKT
ncbi:DUF4135 domain-containing protein, partial [Bacillus subtilis]|uniref:DUF4135 domain-containing protein n=2 Tax=Bacillus TaxID=1386 RepID=UPI001D08B456